MKRIENNKQLKSNYNEQTLQMAMQRETAFKSLAMTSASHVFQGTGDKEGVLELFDSMLEKLHELKK